VSSVRVRVEDDGGALVRVIENSESLVRLHEDSGPLVQVVEESEGAQ
jgi:hypothetical protein